MSAKPVISNQTACLGGHDVLSKTFQTAVLHDITFLM